MIAEIRSKPSSYFIRCTVSLLELYYYKLQGVIFLHVVFTLLQRYRYYKNFVAHTFNVGLFHPHVFIFNFVNGIIGFLKLDIRSVASILEYSWQIQMCESFLNHFSKALQLDERKKADYRHYENVLGFSDI